MFRHIIILLAGILLFGQNAIASPRSQDILAPESAENDLSGYWKYDDDRIVYITQDGLNLRSRHIKDATDFAHYAEEINFTATVRDDLVYGAHLIRLSWPQHRICPVDMWVGLGLTVNDDHTKLTGFRGHRTVNLVSCEIEIQPPVSLVYTRMLGADGVPLRERP